MDDIQGFLAQPFVPVLLAMACIPAFLLILYMVSVYVRVVRRSQTNTQAVKVDAGSQTSGLDLLNSAREQAKYDLHDMPDLDILVPTQSSPKSAPTVKSDLRIVPPTPQRLRLSTGIVTTATELITVLRDERDGRLMVQIGDKGYRSLADSADAKKEFTRVMKELSGVIMQPDDQPPAVAPTPEPEFLAPTPTPKPNASAVTPMPVDSDLPSIGDLARRDAPKPTATPKPKPKVDRSVAMPGDLPSYKFDDNPAVIKANRMGYVKKVEFTPPPDLDIPSAIEAYLQFKLRQTDEFDGRDIHVMPAIGGGVRIKVDDAFYEYVDEVADVEARQFIQEAIAEWQERQG